MYRYQLFLIFLYPFFLFGQGLNTYDIKNPADKKTERCGEYLRTYKKLPVDVRYGVGLQGRTIYFYINSKEYFEQLFNENTDAIAIDIIRRDQYRCLMKDHHNLTWMSRGYLMPPMYKKEMLTKVSTLYEGVFVIYGELPAQFDPENIELNLVVVQKKYFCGYHAFFNIDYENWEILEMGLYKDSLQTDDEKFLTAISKSLTFTIPFEKNKSSFDPDDIKPLYDSLNLTRYNIIEMNIKAYSSVEGSLEKNIQLHESRARSIVNALQQYQKPEIKFDVKANENWVELLNDIQNTRFEYLEKLSKKEVKEELQKKDVRQGIEPILQKHRKAIIQLKLQKKFSPEENNPVILRKYFDQSIEEKNIKEALYLQEIIFTKIRNSSIPEDFIDQLEIPNESVFGPLLNNFEIYYLEESGDNYQTLLNFESLSRIIPENYKIKYNIIALKLRIWTQNQMIATPEQLRKEISELSSSAIDQSLVRRLQINYNILMTEYYYRRGEYSRKNATIKKIYELYFDIQLDDTDLLHLVKYLSHYSRFDIAEKFLEDKVTELGTNEDLLFYYLRLTIGDSRNTRSDRYRTIMLNAIDKNKQRYCNLFLSINQGGYTFQLLDDKYLKKTYCETCN